MVEVSRCGPCGCGMMHTYSAGRKNLYRYYVCGHAQKRGWHTCPSKSVPALALERYVLAQVAPHARHVAWPTLAPGEQAACLRQVVTRIDYDGTSQQVAITLRSTPSTKEKAS